MAEVKNAFIKSKMNKDLDARLLPSGEYRNAINAQVSRSEGADVGALENVLGNYSIQTFEPSIPNTKSIGYLVDEINSNIYVFLTDNATSNYNKDGVGSNHSIHKYNTSTGVSTKIISGVFLNFSQLFPIFGVNILEQLLFWTDNRNQPRKISVNQSLGFYLTEDQISVAKYNPYQSIELWQSASPLAPTDYETTMKDVVSKTLPEGGTCTSVAISNLTTFPITNLDINSRVGATNSSQPGPVSDMTINVLAANGNIIAFDPKLTVDLYTSTSATAGTLKVKGGTMTLDATSTLIFNSNPYYEPNYNGDPNFLTDKFVRFSYRFRFNDGEYSLFAPFTQPCFIPEQDGYFMNTEEKVGDQQQTFDSTVVGFMENKVNKINLRIPLPASKSNLNNLSTSSYKITELDILYKESDGLAVQVVETINVQEGSFTGTSNIYEFEYQSQKPYKTLPEKELIRVYDKIPVKALSQEIISNRIVYGNFQDKHTPPATLNYNVNITEKSNFSLNIGAAVQVGTLPSATKINLTGSTGDIAIGSIITDTTDPSGIPANTSVTAVTGNPVTQIDVSANVTSVAGAAFTFAPAGVDQNTTSIIEYPSSSVKTNRNYQIGVVLADKFGRQSTTILSDNKTAISVGSQNYVGSTLYSPYIDSGTIPFSWPGNSLKVLFNATVPASRNSSTNYPGVYNGDTSDPNYNPLGWYSYKIVVKQAEQEYYNVYTAGALKGSPIDITTDLNTSSVVLINDNINKVPRDLNEVGPQDRSFRSSVQLFGRVENDSTAYSNTGNKQFFPPKRSFTTNTIEDLFDLYDVSESLVTTATCFRYTLTAPNSGDGVTYTECDGTVVNWVFTVNEQTTIVCAQENSLVVVNGGAFVIVANNAPCVINIPITTTDNPYHVFFRAESDPFVALMTTSQVPAQQFGVLNTTSKPYNTIENLAILETEPVVSRLDIFWETSTSGLISDLNNLILNSDGGSAGFSDFNTNAFTEEAGGSAANRKILESDFQLVDNFGANIAIAEVGTPGLEILSVFNTQANPVNNSTYFTLIETAVGSKIWNISITDAFLAASFYGGVSGLRVWDFNFKSNLADGSTNEFTKQVSLGNKVPILYNNLTGTLPGLAPNATATVTHDVAVAIVPFELTATNGAFNGLTNPPKNANRGQELTWTVTATNASGDSVNYFSISPTNTNTLTTAQLNFANNVSAPAVTYTVIITSIDANQDTAKLTLTVNTGVTPQSIEEFVWRAQCDEDGYDDFIGTRIRITGSGVSGQDGYYIFPDTWTTVSLGNTTIQIPAQTNSACFINASGTTCDRENQWMYALSGNDVMDLFAGKSINPTIQGCSGCGDGSGNEISTTTIDFTGEAFEIIP